MPDILIIKELDESRFYSVCGPYHFVTISQTINEDGDVDFKERQLQEAYDSAARAIHAAKERCKQGYRVDVYQRIAISVAD